jgi:hypothetical protein
MLEDLRRRMVREPIDGGGRRGCGYLESALGLPSALNELPNNPRHGGAFGLRPHGRFL